MKGIMRLIVLAVIILAGCSKQKAEKGTLPPSAWKETDHYYSIGGPIIWKETEPTKAEIIQFKPDNVFYSSVHTKLNRYEWETINTAYRLKLYEAGKTDTTYWFVNTLTPDTLEIGFSGCIEGCGKRFVLLEEK